MQQSVRRELFGGAFLIETAPWEDHRGAFLETYREDDLMPFVQGNLSVSKARVVRGLHYQIRKPQGKFMRTVAGVTFNAIVDVRASSPTFGQAAWTYIDNPNLALWVPPGFANGFAALANGTTVYYETSTYYFAGFDRGIRPFDPNLGIPWPKQLADGITAILSDKDANAPMLTAAELVPESEWRIA